MKMIHLAAVLTIIAVTAAGAAPVMAFDVPIIDEDDFASLPDLADDGTPAAQAKHDEIWDAEDDSSGDGADVTPMSGTGTVTASVNFRSSAGTGGNNIIGTIPQGSSVRLLLLTDSGWYRVEWKGQKGYVSEKYMQIGSAAPSEEPKTGKTGAEPEEDPDEDLDEDLDEDQDEDQDKDVSPAMFDGTVTQRANFRSEPGYGDNVIGAIPAGADVDIIGETEGGWYMVYYRGQTGFVYHGLVDRGSSSAEGDGVLTRNVNFRSAPDPSDPGNIIGGIPAGAKVTVIEDTYNAWYKVTWNGMTGYVYGAYVEL